MIQRLSFLLIPTLIFFGGCGTAETESPPIASHTPTPTPGQTVTTEPTPLPSPTLTTVPKPTPISTSTSAGESCNVWEEPFDASLVGSGQYAGVTAEFRYSGNDEHMVMTLNSPEGIATDRGEQIFNDGTHYVRDSVPGEPDVYGEWRVQSRVRQPFTRPPCVDPDRVAAGDSDSSDEPHYVSEVFLSAEEGTVRDEYWADPEGRPIRGLRKFFPPGTDTESGNYIGLLEYTYSGYGEPNVIEAPCVPSMADC